jgi:uncharacterized membrane protein
LLASIGVLAIPGFGPLLAAGPLVAILTGVGAGAAVGAVAGGLVGALIVAGVPEAAAHRYAESVRSGGTLVAVTAEGSRAPMVEQIMKRCGAVEVSTHARQEQQEAQSGAVPGRNAGLAREATTPGLAVTEPGHGADRARRLDAERNTAL